MNTESDRGLGE